jgi:hypothetical protein
MSINEAIALLRANGYRVSIPRKRDKKPNGLNAIGKPYGQGFDPKYRMRYRTPSLQTKRGGSIGSEISPEQWACMVKKAQEQWDESMRTGCALPLNMGR